MLKHGLESITVLRGEYHNSCICVSTVSTSVRRQVLWKAPFVCETAGAAFSWSKLRFLKGVWRGGGTKQTQNPIQSTASSYCLITLRVVYTMPSARTRSSIGP